MELKQDCKFYIGEKPCIHQRLCEGCDKYDPMGTRILIIKLAAIGDVLRTTPLLDGLKRRYPRCQITWLTSPVAADLLRPIPQIDRLMAYTWENVMRLEVEQFDVMICLDKEPKATALAMQIRAHTKVGVGMGPQGNPFPLNKEFEYCFSLGLDNDLKFRRNQKPYQQLIFEGLGLEFQGEQYRIGIPETEKVFGRELFARNGVTDSDLVLGLNTGAGTIFANKSWTISGYVDLIGRIRRVPRVRVALLGGPEERVRNREIVEAVKNAPGAPVIDTGCDNTLLEFCGVMDRCDIVVTGDTMAMHIAIALGKKVVAIFGPTCAQEIDLYGQGEKITTTIECAPCYLKVCPKTVTCMDLISVEEVHAAVARLTASQRSVDLSS